MPDDLYERDILLWSEQQASLLRRVASGDPTNKVDWSHVIEEIEDVGVAALNNVRSFLRQTMAGLLRFHLVQTDASHAEWPTQVDTFLADAELWFAPSMRQRIDLDGLWDRAKAAMHRHAAPESAALPEQCPWPLDDLLAADPYALLATLAKPPGTP